jgi:hypothetical protein
VHTAFWWRNLRRRRPLGKPRRKWEDNIKVGLQENGWESWTGMIWRRMETSGGNS